MNPPTPEDLVEAYHFVVANHDEPVSWKMGMALWNAVTRVATANGVETPLNGEDRQLLGLPVEIGHDHPFAPILFVRHGKAIREFPVFGTAIEV